MSDAESSQTPFADREARLELAVRSIASEPVPPNSVARVKARALSIQGASLDELDPRCTLPSSLSAGLAPRRPDKKSPRFPPVLILSRSLLVKCVTIVSVLAVAATVPLLQTSPKNVFGEVIKQVREARSFRYLKRLEVEGRPNPIEVKIMVAEDGRQRHEQSGGSIMILDPTPQIRLTLISRTKTAIVSEPHAIPANRVAKHPLEWLEVLKSNGDKPDKQLDKRMLGEREVDGFVTTQGQSTYTIWIDSQTKELVQVEHDLPVKGMSVTKVVMSEFRFNEKLDESLFSFDAPEGFKIINSNKLDISQATGGETGMVEALRGYTKKSGGKFPGTLTDLSDFANLMSQGNAPGQIDPESRKTLYHFSSILPFLSSLRKSDYDYLGAGKSVNDNRCIVFWYRDKNSKLRAIHNDLSVSEVLEKDIK